MEIFALVTKIAVLMLHIFFTKAQMKLPTIFDFASFFLIPKKLKFFASLGVIILTDFPSWVTLQSQETGSELCSTAKFSFLLLMRLLTFMNSARMLVVTFQSLGSHLAVTLQSQETGSELCSTAIFHSLFWDMLIFVYFYSWANVLILRIFHGKFYMKNAISKMI